MQETTEHKFVGRPRTMNDCIAAAKQMPSAAMLFDEFWREGEVAVLYGPDRIGKSVLAIQIAEALASGRKIDGFQMRTSGMKVLYVDLRLTDMQIAERYLLKPDGNSPARSYIFDANLCREIPSDLADIAAWIRKNVKERGFQAVIVDDLQALQTRSYGAKEAMELMIAMRKLCVETGVSVLFIAGSESVGPTKLPDENDLRHLRPACRRADSSFAMERNCRHTAERYLIQTRSPRRLYWTAQKAPVCKMWSSSEVPLSFVFDERFRADGDSERRTLILGVKQAHDRGESFASIAKCFEIPKTKAYRLYKEWRPSMEYTKTQIAAQIAEAEAEERAALEQARRAEIEEQQAIAEFQENSAKMDEILSEGLEPNRETATEIAAEQEIEAFVDIDPLSDLTRTTNDWGKEIFIERYNGRGQPEIWYQFDNQGHLHHMQLDSLGRSGHIVDGPVCWLQWSASDGRYYNEQKALLAQPPDAPDADVVSGGAGDAQFAVQAQMR